MKYQAEIGGIHIRIRENGAIGLAQSASQVSKSSAQAGFSGATLAAEDHKLFHSLPWFHSIYCSLDLAEHLLKQRAYSG
jgi:hypothetical protein